MNKVMLIGRLARDPELKYTQGGTAVCNFTVAVNRRIKNAEGQYDADFINCTAWNKTAEFIGEYFKKGQMIGLEGRIQVRSYDAQDGSKRWVTEVVVEQSEFVEKKSGTGETTGSDRDDINDMYNGEIVFNDNDLPF